MSCSRPGDIRGGCGTLGSVFIWGITALMSGHEPEPMVDADGVGVIHHFYAVAYIIGRHAVMMLVEG